MSITFGPGIAITGNTISANVSLGAPVVTTATVVSATTATVTFTAPPLNGNPPIQYFVATSSPGSITATITQSGSGTITVSGLTSGQTYNFTVAAFNIFGTGLTSVSSNCVTLQTVPGAPTMGTAARISTSTSATVSFTAPANNGGATITSYLSLIHI